jgi:hypothetical protein
MTYKNLFYEHSFVCGVSRNVLITLHTVVQNIKIFLSINGI